MQTQDILENQPWTLIEDEMMGEEIPEITEEQDTIKKELVEPTVPQQPTSDNPFKYLAEDLGLSIETDWDGDADEFKELLLTSVKEELVGEMQLDNPIVDGFLKYVSNGGKPEEFIQAMSVPAMDRMTPEEIYITYMKSTTSLSDDKIKKMMFRSKDSGEFEEEVESFKEEMKTAQDEQIKEILVQQEEIKQQRLELARKASIERKRLAKSKSIMGIPVTKNAEFEKFYLQPTEKVVHDGKSYMVTQYQKRIIERQQTNPLEYEALLAYLEFVNYKLPGDAQAIRTEVTRDLKSKLGAYYSTGNKTTRLIDES